MIQTRISEITQDNTADVGIAIKIDIHNGRSWHHDAIVLYASTIHEGVRLSLAMCDALDKLSDFVPGRPR